MGRRVAHDPAPRRRVRGDREGLLEPTWFTPQLQSHPYGVALGVFWTYAAFNIVYHAVFSIAIPILLTELVFPRWRDEPWLGRAGLAVTGAVYAVNAAAIGVLWWTVLQASVFHVPARAHPVQQGTTVALVIVLIVVAWRSAPVRLFTPGGARPPSAGRLGGRGPGHPRLVRAAAGVRLGE